MLSRLQLVALGVLLPRGTDGLRLSTAPRTRCALAATASAAPHKLEAIECAPSTPWLQPSAFELSEGIGGGMVGHGAWCSAMRALCTSETFQTSGWAQRPFKLDERWQFAVNSYTMADVARDVTLLPPQFIASGVRVGDGIYNKPMDPGFSAADVEARMETATVVLLNAGFLVPKLARVSLAMLEVPRPLRHGTFHRIRIRTPSRPALIHDCRRRACPSGSTCTSLAPASLSRRSCTPTSRTCFSFSARGASGGASTRRRQRTRRRTSTRTRVGRGRTSWKSARRTCSWTR